MNWAQARPSVQAVATGEGDGEGGGEIWSQGRGRRWLPWPCLAWVTLAVSPVLWDGDACQHPFLSGSILPSPSPPCCFPSSCVHGRLSCSVGNCSKAADGFSPWGPWGPCSRSCGGLGTRTRSRQCVQASLAPGSQGCRGTRQELKYCPSPDCPGEGSGKGESGQIHLSPSVVLSCLCPSQLLSLDLSSSPASSVCLFDSGVTNVSGALAKCSTLCVLGG